MKNTYLVLEHHFYQPLWDKDIVFRFATGYYYQTPFYRELRDFNGNLNTNIKSQKSIHYVLGSDYNFKIWQRPFKLVTELYYKDISDLIPYEVENIRIVITPITLLLVMQRV